MAMSNVHAQSCVRCGTPCAWVYSDDHGQPLCSACRPKQRYVPKPYSQWTREERASFQDDVDDSFSE